MLGDPRAARDERTARISSIDGAALLRAFAGGTEALRRQADAINAINVFPIPDGDTGTNMYMTMRAALDDAERASGASALDVAKAAAHGALMGAKGNSGVILSQILDGLAGMPAPTDTLDATALAHGLERARVAAYRVVSEPKEGTILTAISAAAAAARTAADAREGAESALEAAVHAAEDAVARTPELLPVLKEAGVVDSGAQGLFVLLEGMLCGLRGEASVDHAGGFGAIDASWIGATQRLHERDDIESGFCTEFVVRGERLDADAMRARLNALGDSLLVVGGGDLARVHIHTPAPDEVLGYGRSVGVLVHEKVDDMEAQFRALAARRAAPLPRTTGGIAVVAVGAGAGIEELLRSMGATVVRGGQTMNPSAGELRSAIEATGAPEVIVLPNNKNIVLAANQAADGLAIRARVIETRSVPEGVAALIALNTEATFDENIDAMRAAASNVSHAEVTLAARPTKLQGVAVRKGQPIGIVDGELQVAEATVADAVRACVARMVEGRDAPLVTLYAGEGEDDASSEAIAGSLRQHLGVEVEVVLGGQPHYPYLIGVDNVAVRIVTDSTSDIPRAIAQELDITFVPLTVSFGAQSFRDGIDMSADDFYARLQQEKELPTTSQPPPSLFQHAYEHLITLGDVVSVHLSHKFSGTVETARRAARETAPERITVVDSGSASMGLGLCAIAAARAARAGANRAACAAAAEAVAGRLQIAVAFETLEYLRRGGRIGRAAAFLGGLLRLKPILTVKDGEAFPVTRVRSRAKAIEELFSLCTKHQGISDIAVLHTTTPDDAADLARRAAEAVPGATVYRGRFGPVLGVHGGPGMLGMCVVAET